MICDGVDTRLVVQSSMLLEERIIELYKVRLLNDIYSLLHYCFNLHNKARHKIDFVLSIVIYVKFTVSNIISQFGSVMLPTFELPIDGR